MNLKNKKVLITSGPTWVAIDKIRVISNVATGKTGSLLASLASKSGAYVTLLLGPAPVDEIKRSIRIKHFRFFDEFRALFMNELKKKPDVVIHSAAVSDYQPKRTHSSKIRSDLKRLSLSLVLTPKLADSVKKISPRTFFIIFKLEKNVPKNTLVNRAFELLKRTKADLVVANTFSDRTYKAFIIDSKKKIISTANSKESLTKALIKNIKERI